MGAFGPALMFMMTLVGGCILVLCVLTYAMHCLLVVTSDTAAGQDEIVWPDEPFQDWAVGALHLVGVVLVVLAPAGVLARALRETWLTDNPLLRFLLLALPALWLFFPVALFSSLSGSSRWFVLRPAVVWNLARVAPYTLTLYVVSALMAGGVAALGYATVAGWAVLAPAAAAAAGTAFLIYARLLGRLAWKMGRLPSAKRQPAAKARLPQGRVERPDPWAAPQGTEPQQQPEMETTPYGQKRRRVKGYGLAPPESPREGPKSEEYTAQPPARRETPPVRKRRPRPSPARRPFFAGVFTFPGYGSSRKAWLLLSLGFLALYGLAYALIHLYTVLYRDG